MTAPHPVAASLTPAERFEAAAWQAVRQRGRAHRQAAQSGAVTQEHLSEMDCSLVDAVRAAAGEMAAALVEECARTPRSQMDPMQMRRGDAS